MSAYRKQAAVPLYPKEETAKEKLEKERLRMIQDKNNSNVRLSRHIAIGTAIMTAALIAYGYFYKFMDTGMANSCGVGLVVLLFGCFGTIFSLHKDD